MSDRARKISFDEICNSGATIYSATKDLGWLERQKAIGPQEIVQVLDKIVGDCELLARQCREKATDILPWVT